MNAIFATLLTLVLLGPALPAVAATDADCKTMWEKADINKDGTLDGAEVTAYLNAIKANGKTYDANTDGKLASAEFTEACKAGIFKDMKS